MYAMLFKKLLTVIASQEGRGEAGRWKHQKVLLQSERPLEILIF